MSRKPLIRLAVSIAVVVPLFPALFVSPAGAAPAGTAGLAEATGGFPPFAWTISSSFTDPLVNSGPPTGSSTLLFLWLYRGATGGVPCGGATAAEFMFSTSGQTFLLDFFPEAGFVNAGVLPCVAIAANDCHEDPILVGSLLVLGGEGQICLAPCAADGNFGTVACDATDLSPMAWRGFSFGTAPPCEEGQIEGHVDFGAACCLGDGTCVNVNNDCECYALGGTPQGWPSGCDPAACCLPDGSCIEVLDSGGCSICEQMGGVVHLFTTCDELYCGPVSLDPQSWGRAKALYRN